MFGKDKSGYSDSNKWREKYLSMLDEQEENEKRYERQLELLSRGLSRVSIAAGGLDQALDEDLGQLRRLLRKGESGKLAAILDKMDSTILKLDRNKQLRIEQMLQALMEMCIQLQHLSLDSNSKKLLKSYLKNLKKRIENEFEHSSLVDEYAHIQAAALQALQAPPAQDSSRLFSSPPVQPASHDTADDDDEQDLLELDALSAEPATHAAGQDEPPFSTISRDIEHILGSLLSQLEAKGSARSFIDTAQQQLQQGLDCEKLPPTLEDISQAVLLLQSEGKKEFAEYLASLNARLQEMHEFLQAANRQNRENGDTFNLSMQQQISALGSSVAEATDLSQLKQSVQHQLDSLLTAVDDFREKSSTSQDSLSQKLESLVERVEAMERDSELTRQQIEEQRQLAITDKLTGLPNREAYEERLQLETARWQRYQHGLCLVVADADHFKQINDTWGHLAGDKVLKVIAKTLEKRLRETDFIARFGGEEFVILLPETDAESALNLINEMRENVAACPFHFRNEPVQITISMGVACFHSSDESSDAVFERADKALYLAKKNGRNRCCSETDLGDSESVN